MGDPHSIQKDLREYELNLKKLEKQEEKLAERARTLATREFDKLQKEFGADLVPLLAIALRHHDVEVRRWAACALGEIGTAALAAIGVDRAVDRD